MNINLPGITFDFRDHANPADELKGLWDSWVPYYTTKAAIAAWLKPAKILEIGVRYGYSAKAFLAGSPAAHYTGIDLNVKTNGGAADDFAWAKLILPIDTALIKGDTQKMGFLPGGVYDLIHVDGQQTGASTYHDLELASAQGHWILCDGYFWTSENFNAANDFIRNYRDIIETVIILTGYAGEMLINIKDSYLKSNLGLLDGGMSGESLREFYINSISSMNWSGHDASLLNSGGAVEDMRNAPIADIAFSNSPNRILDIFCAKGDLTVQGLLAGASATAVDCSKNALEIAKVSVANIQKSGVQVEWINEFPATMKLQGKYDAVICADAIEHMTSAEVDSMYATVSNHLTEGGQFIVHSFPNRWYYDYDYPHRQREAAKLGAHLPFQPRSRIERLMHINEQKPQEMRRQLKRHFKHVLFWFASPTHPAGNLILNMSRRQLAGASDLYAVASHRPIDKAEIIKKLAPTPPLKIHQATSIKLSCSTPPRQLNIGEVAEINVEVSNQSDVKIGVRLPNLLMVSYHWQDALTGAIAIFDGERTSIGSIYIGQTIRTTMRVSAPLLLGRYILQLRLVQEGVRWHEGEGFDTVKLDHLIQVV